MSDAVIDVRPVIASGGEPLSEILAAAGTVPEGGRLVVIAPFEPMPLYGVMRELGFSHAKESISGGGVRVLFTRDQGR